MAYDINVTFNNDKESVDSRDLSWAGKDQQDKDIANTKKQVSKNASLTNGLAFGAGRQIFMNAVGRYGSYTGDYMAQNKINNAFSILGVAAALYTMNPLAIAAVSIDTAFKILDYNVDVTKSNIEAEALQNLAGISAVNRSRGGGGKV